MKLLKAWAMLGSIALWTLSVQQAACASEKVGVRQIAAPSKERGINLDDATDQYGRCRFHPRA